MDATVAQILSDWRIGLTAEGYADRVNSIVNDLTTPAKMNDLEWATLKLRALLDLLRFARSRKTVVFTPLLRSPLLTCVSLFQLSPPLDWQTDPSTQGLIDAVSAEIEAVLRYIASIPCPPKP